MPVKTPPDRRYLCSKRAFDVAGASLFLVLLLPLMVVAALVIRLDTPGPVLFHQKRYGHYRRIFTLHKFRTMRHEDRDLLGAVQEELHDTRVTRVGRLLRRTSIDEFPQLWNVLKGDMSLVGPRPHPIGMRTQGKLCSEVSSLYCERYSAKPGLTGWAQVNGWRGPTRSVGDLVARTDYDIEYVHRQSLAFDLRILGLTIVHLLTPRRPKRSATSRGASGVHPEAAHSYVRIERPLRLRVRQATLEERQPEVGRARTESREEQSKDQRIKAGAAP